MFEEKKTRVFVGSIASSVLIFFLLCFFFFLLCVELYFEKFLSFFIFLFLTFNGQFALAFGTPVWNLWLTKLNENFPWTFLEFCHFFPFFYCLFSHCADHLTTNMLSQHGSDQIPPPLSSDLFSHHFTFLPQSPPLSVVQREGGAVKQGPTGVLHPLGDSM